MNIIVTFFDHFTYSLNVTIGDKKINFGEPYTIGDIDLINMLKHVQWIKDGNDCKNDKYQIKRPLLCGSSGNSSWSITFNESNKIIMTCDISGSGDDLSFSAELPIDEMVIIIKLIKDINISIGNKEIFATDNPNIKIVRDQKQKNYFKKTTNVMN